MYAIVNWKCRESGPPFAFVSGEAYVIGYASECLFIKMYHTNHMVTIRPSSEA